MRRLSQCIRASIAVAATGLPASAQLCTEGEPTTLGTVVQVAGACQGGVGSQPNTTCILVDVHCTGLNTLRAQLRITPPNPGVPVRGTVVFGSGGGGSGFYSSPDLFSALTALGYRVIVRAWAAPSGWTTAEAGLRRESCRYATLITWVRDTLHTGGDFCVSGNSGGAAEIGYALTTWGRGDIIDVAVPTSGPAVARLDYVCPAVVPAEWVTLCQTIVPPGMLTCVGGWDCSIAGNGVCVDCTNAPTSADLRADSVMHLDAVVDYPFTRCHFLYGERDCGVSVPMGLTWSLNVTSEAVIEFVPETPHALFSTVQGRDAIVRAIVGAAPPPPCPGDANGDRVVDFGDVTSVLAGWGGGGPGGDANHDGVVNFGDVTAALANFGVPCP